MTRPEHDRLSGGPITDGKWHEGTGRYPGEPDDVGERQATPLSLREFGPPSQTRLMSLVEAVVNTAIGLGVSLALWPVVAWLSPDVDYSPAGHLAVPAVFTAASVARSYVVRRFFATRIHAFAAAMASKLRRWMA